MSPHPRGDTVLYWTISFGVVDTLSVMLRFFVRKKSGTKIAADDWMILASLLPAYGMIIFASLCVSKGGAGKHAADLTSSEFTLLLKYIIPAFLTWGLTITIVKISILLLYRRIFVTVAFHRASLFVGFLCITWLCGDVFSEIFLCSPVSALWDPKLIFSNQCRDIQAFFLGITVSGLLLDVVILCMPLPMVWNLNFSTRRKLEVSGIFLLGSFCIASFLRILTINNLKNIDFPYTFMYMYLWSHIEPATAIWCACLMTYGPLFADVGSRFQGIFGSNRKASSTRNKPSHINKSNNGSGSNPDAWPSRGRNLCGKESAAYRDLDANIAMGDVHAINFSAKPCSPDRCTLSSADKHEQLKISVERGSSPV